MSNSKENFLKEFQARILKDAALTGEWAWEFNQGKSSSLDGSELLGELRERRMILRYIDGLTKDSSNPEVIFAYKELWEAINNCEHN